MPTDGYVEDVIFFWVRLIQGKQMTINVLQLLIKFTLAIIRGDTTYYKLT